MGGTIILTRLRPSNKAYGYCFSVEMTSGFQMVRAAFAILLLGLIAWSTLPVYAHTTLGDLNGLPPLYRSNDNELNPTNTFGRAHVPGPLGYLWPGSGLNTYSGIAQNPPGYQSPFSTSELPAQQGSYAPEGAILASTAETASTGDLIFAINFSQPQFFLTPGNSHPDFTYSSLALYLPAPAADKYGAFVQDGFQPVSVNWDQGENTNIVTTITDDYTNVLVTRAPMTDPFSPGSWLVLISGAITFTAARHWSEWYYVRINGMEAPHVAGRYFFKIFLDNHYPAHKQQRSPSLITSTMPMENWPMLLVKGEMDPAIISGTLRYGGYSDDILYAMPIKLPGVVRAVGFATDPLTGQPTGRAVEARGYFNATSEGHFEIEGIAAGIYSIYASAAGLPEQNIGDNVRVGRGQSLHLDGYLKVGPQLRGNIFSKQGYGAANWAAQRPISVVIYDSDSYDIPSIVAYSPINLTDSPYTSYATGNTVFSTTGFSGLNPTFASPKKVAFPWEGPTSYYAYTVPFTKDPFGLFNGVGPAQVWWVDPRSNLDPNTGLGSGRSEFTFQFGADGAYGVPTKLSGMVPQVFATWTDSLAPGTYYVRVYVNGYIQSSSDGREFIDYPFTITGGSSQLDIVLPIDIEQSSTINVTIHFHNRPGTLLDSAIQGPDPSRFLIVEAFSSNGTVTGFNFTQVTFASSSASVTVNGLGMAGPILPPDPRAFTKYSLATYQGLYDYGLPPDTYTIRVYMRGYIQAQPPAMAEDQLDWPLIVTVSTSSGVLATSTEMYRGGSINATVLSVDWESPSVPRNWVWPNAPVNVLVYAAATSNFIDVIHAWNAKQNLWFLPPQNSNFDTLPWSGWRTSFGAGASYLVTNGSTYVDRYGPDVANPISADPAQDMATPVFFEENVLLGFLYDPSYYQTTSYSSKLAIYPGVYALNAWTYGYVQDGVFRLGDLGKAQASVATLGSQADVSIRILIGVNFTIGMLFKDEGVISGIPFNASVRLWVLDQTGSIVAAATLESNAGRLAPSSNEGFYADGNKLLTRKTVPAESNFLIYSDLAGLFNYTEPSSSKLSVQRLTLFSPDHGIWGLWTYGNGYAGSWTVIVDLVNWYNANSFYPPAPALLQGESPLYFPYNHLGPYRSDTQVTIPNAVVGGEASVQFGLELRGYVQGTVLGFDWDYEVRTISWAAIQLRSTDINYYWYSWDGWFDGYVDPAEYRATVTIWPTSGEGYRAFEFNLSVSPGQISRAESIILEESGVPIPEFSSHLPVLVGILLACLFSSQIRAHRRRRKAS